MGTPDFAAESLKALIEWGGCDIVGVYTQPDRPCGRGQECKPSPVKKLALEHGLDVYQPVNFKDQSDVDALKALGADVLAVAAYGLILPQNVLDACRIMPVNVHASLLPKHRGAAPIQRAIQEGDFVTGITIMKMELGLDTGPILLQRALRIGHDQHAGDLHDELAAMGGLMLVEALMRVRDGRLRMMPQEDDRATYAAKLSKKEGEIDWNRDAEVVHNHIRAMHPWPGAYFFWTGPEGKKIRLTLTPGEIGPELDSDIDPGTVLGEMDGKLAITCRDRIYLVPQVKPEGRKAQDATAFTCGYLSKC